MINKSLTARWTTPEGARIAHEVIVRLRKGKRLTGLPLGQHEGRIDLRGLVAPPATPVRTSITPRWFIHQLSDLIEVRGARLEHLDMTGARMDHWRFFECTIADCRFDQAHCQDWRMWATSVAETTFRGADLRQSVLGSWYKGRGNTYHRCDFSRTNLSEIVSLAATFVDCDFLDVRVEKVNFDGTSFIRCRFGGLLREVMFYGHSRLTEKPDPNLIEDVDFTQAELSMVEFRGLDLDRVKFPQRPEYVLIGHYRCVLEATIGELSESDSLRDRVWRAILEDRFRWIGPSQTVGLFNRRDLVEMGDDDSATFLIGLLRHHEDECSARSN